RARAVQASFQLTNANAPAVAAICTRLDGLPLAIELAAALERVLGVEEILARLSDTFGLLIGVSRTAPTRHQRLWATLDWSHALVSAGGETVFRRVAVFVGGWNLAAAEAVGGGGEVAPDEVLSLLTRLVDTSLVLEEELDGRARYRLLEPLRDFAKHQLQRSGESDVIQRAHAQFFAQWAPRLAMSPVQDLSEIPMYTSRMDQMERDYPNFRTALVWLSEHGPIDTALRLANALAEFWYLRAHQHDGRMWMTKLLCQPGGDPGPRARALGWAGNFAASDGDIVAAQELHAACLPLDEEIDDKVHLACVYNALGRDALALGEYAEAERLLGEALDRFASIGTGGVLMTAEEIWALYSLGETASAQCDSVRAAAIQTRCLQRAKAVGGGVGGGLQLESWALGGLARAAQQL